MPAGLSDPVAPAPGAALPAIDAESFRQGMAWLAGAVNIVTAAGVDGPAGFTATAVCSVSAEPPILLVCLNTGSSAAPAFARAEVLCVNTLAAGQADLGQHFGAKVPMASRFARGQWRAGDTGAPVLDGALVAFEARIKEVQRMGTHDVMFCEVVVVHQGAAEEGPSVYWNRCYHALTGSDAPG